MPGLQGQVSSTQEDATFVRTSGDDKVRLSYLPALWPRHCDFRLVRAELGVILCSGSLRVLEKGGPKLCDMLQVWRGDGERETGEAETGQPWGCSLGTSHHCFEAIALTGLGCTR